MLSLTGNQGYKYVYTTVNSTFSLSIRYKYGRAALNLNSDIFKEPNMNYFIFLGLFSSLALSENQSKFQPMNPKKNI